MSRSKNTGTGPVELGKKLEDLIIRGRVRIIQMQSLFRTVRVLKRVL